MCLTNAKKKMIVDWLMKFEKATRMAVNLWI